MRLNPSCVYITPFSSAKVDGFGPLYSKGQLNRYHHAMEKSMASSRLEHEQQRFYVAPEILRGEKCDESCDTYSFGMLLLDMAVEPDILSFVVDRWNQRAHVVEDEPREPIIPVSSFSSSFSSGSARCSDSREALVAITHDRWRPVGLQRPEESIAFAPPVINELILRCCDAVAPMRPSFRNIVKDIEGKLLKEINEGSRRGAPYGRREKTHYTVKKTHAVVLCFHDGEAAKQAFAIV